MNAQVRKIFVIVLGMFLALGVASTLIQFVYAPDLGADGRNVRRLLQAAERDRGPIVVAGEPVAYSERLEDSRRYQRTYPQGPLYAGVTGYFSAMNLSATGIEAAEDEVLEGDSSELFWQRVKNLFAGKERQGGGVTLTLDQELQQVAADSLGGRAGAVVAMEAKTGKILSLYSSPTFDPNPLASLDTAVAEEASQNLNADPSRPLVNRAIGGDLYAPGSVFKILTVTAMLESGVTPETVLPSPPSTILPGTETPMYNNEDAECGSGEVSLTEAFARSCNTTFAIASEKLPARAMQDVTARFGFGDGISIPLSVTPSSFPEEPSPAELAMSAIGQFDVKVTPLQMAMVTQAVANGGAMMQPYLVDTIRDADNRVRSQTEPSVLSNPLTAEQASSINAMMRAVVDQPFGTGQSMAIDGVSVAAKTGTAETQTADGQVRANAWAVGFAPAEDPQIVVSVIVEGDDNDPIPHGGDVAGPIARTLMERGLN